MAIFSFRRSRVAARVKKATNRHLIDSDWTMNMGICEAINSDRRQAKDAIKAIKRRLQHKKSKVQYLALMLLEIVMQNCGDYVHEQVIERNILQEMTKIVNKTEMPISKKILELLDSWKESFGGQGGKYPQYYWAYAELRRSGVAFPQRSLDNPQVLTPPSQSALTSAHPQAGYGASKGLGKWMTSDVGNLSVSDLIHIRNAMELLSDMVQAVKLRDRVAAKDGVINDLVNQCRSNQKRLVQLLGSTGGEELLRQGIELNDNLQSLLAKHDALASGASLPPEVSKPVLKEKNPIPAPAVNNQFEEEDDDDEFAQLARRHSKFTAERNNSVNSSNTFLPNWSGAMIATNSSSTAEGAPSLENKSLVLLDHSAPVQTQMEEPNLIDLLNLTLTTSESSPHTYVTPPSAAGQQVYSISAAPSGQCNLYNSQPYSTNQGFSPYNSYVAPWAQHALLAPEQQFSPQPQSSQNPYSYPAIPDPQWAGPSVMSYPNPFTTYQWAPYANYLSIPLQHYTSFGSTENYASPFEETQGNAKLQKEEFPTGYTVARPLQNHNSFSLKANYAKAPHGEADLNSNLHQAALQTGYISRPLQSYNPFASCSTPSATGATQENTN